MNCVNCHTQLFDGAKFCHHCGTKAPSNECPSCNSLNPEEGHFCLNCGTSLEPPTLFDDSKPAKNASEKPAPKTSTDQLKSYFFKALKARLLDEGNEKQYDEYVSLFYESGFDQRFLHKAKWLAEKIQESENEETFVSSSAGILFLTAQFEPLLDYFQIVDCKSINQVELPESILRYENANLSNTDLGLMIYDYLELEKENLDIYTDFISIPQAKMVNAANSFLKAESRERLYLLIDQTLLGSCKEGFAITDRGLYWKANFRKPQQLTFPEIQEVKMEAGWVSINQAYLTVNKNVNLKVIKLLKKIQFMIDQTTSVSK